MKKPANKVRKKKSTDTAPGTAGSPGIPDSPQTAGSSVKGVSDGPVIPAGLIVPVDIAALCVGIIDQQDNNQGTSNFAGATTLFTNQTGDNQAFLGSNVVLSFLQSPWQQLKTGIHLHWALPQALTHGVTGEDGNVGFLAAPNRWLVSRIITTGSTLTRTSWVVESDYCWDKKPAGQDSITLPVKQINPNDPNFKYIGRQVVFDGNWQEPDQEGLFKQLTGTELNAVANGEVSFAAFYPDCLSVFGFFDTMAGVIVKGQDTVNILYEVTGWYSNANNDPLNGGKTQKQLQESYEWTFDDTTSPGALPVYSLYSGLIQDIAWNPNNKYIVDQPLQQPIPAIVTVGNTPPETFSAYFKAELYPEQPFFETLLDGFQLGILDSLQHPSPDQLAKLEEAIHQDGFASHQAGAIYLVVLKNDNNEEVPVGELPLALATALNLLNVYRQQLDDYTFYVQNFQWQLFSNWYRLMKTTDTTIRNELYALIMERISVDWKNIQLQFEQYTNRFQNQEAAVTQQLAELGEAYKLNKADAPRYWQPNEPVILITTSEQQKLRFGKAAQLRNGFAGQAQTEMEGFLFCRLTTQLLTAITVASKNISAGNFTYIAFPVSNHLPYPDTCNSLLLESCLLNTSVIGALTGVPATDLATALANALNGQPQTTYEFTGTLPAPLTVTWWDGNSWSSIFLQWGASFYPLQATEKNGELQDYPESFFTDNYTIGTSEGGRVTYKGSLNPATINFSFAPVYAGGSVMTTSAAQSFSNQLDEYLSDHTDPDLEKIRQDLNENLFFAQSLNGFNSLLSMQEQQMQLNIKVSSQNPYLYLTASVAEIAGQAGKVSPVPNGNYNPIRAGFLQLELHAIDVYGQKRKIDIDELLTSSSLATWFQKKLVPDIVYMPSRFSQPTRLLFRWLAAVGSGLIQEMDALPAITPVMGWIMPNHLDGGLFFYDQQGKPLGSLLMNGNETAVLWQSAPGDDATIDQTVQQVFQLQPAAYRDMAIALSNATTTFFNDFREAIDNMHNFINPQNYAQNTELAVLIGRPVAVVQAMLQLELSGGPVYNQSWTAIKEEEYETDNRFTDVLFPVILGDMKKVDDGLIGYFKEGATGYNYSSFYTQAASGTGGNGVIRPDETNITLSCSKGKGAFLTDARHVLMLMDPRASVHATTGVLPTKAIDIPASMYTDTLSILEVTFLITPVLHGTGSLNIPLPKEEGYQWSWVEEISTTEGNEWLINSDINPPTGQAVYNFTPQVITEGWLRLNPVLLEFALLNSQQQPVAKAGSTVALQLVLTNSKPGRVIFMPGQLIAEEQPNTGSAIYIHFGEFVRQLDVPDIQITAAGWQFQALSGTLYGNYWEATPLAPVTVEPGQTISFQLVNLKTVDETGQRQLFFDYFNITGLNDGVSNCIITLEKS